MPKLNKEKNKTTNSFSKSIKGIGSTGKNLGNSLISHIKELPNLPWDKLPKDRYIVLIVALIRMILIFLIFNVWL